MKSKNIALIAILIAALLTSLLLAYVSYSTDAHLIEFFQQREMRLVSSIIQNDLREQASQAAARVSLVSNLTYVAEALRKQDREQLVRMLLPAFLIQREKYGAREAMFHLPPGISFLRLYNLNEHGEDLTGFREIVLMTNKTHQPQKGVEIGKRGLSIRAVDVIDDQKGVIGTFEIGMDFSTILNDIKHITGFEAGVFVDDRLMQKIATQVGRPDQQHLIGNYQAVDSTDWEKLRQTVTPQLLSSINDVTYRTQNVNDVEYGVVVVPLLDFKGQQIGYIVAISNFQKYVLEFRSNVIYTVAFAVLQLIILAGVIMIVFNTLCNHSTSIEQIPSVDDKAKKTESSSQDPGQNI